MVKKALLELLLDGANGEQQHQSAQKRLQTAYLGFCVVRPIPSAPIGRTVLRPYKDLASRIVPTAHVHRVHLCGLELEVSGVPFQQQETAVGACATTAIWSALAVAARNTGRRAPTPFEVTDAATKHLINDRPFPADSGLDLQQALGAVRAHGFSPHTFKPSDTPSLFSFVVKAYLRSGFPVVLLLRDGAGYHAVTAVGYRELEPDSENVYVYGDGQRQLETSHMDRVYVHEDRLGPYARMQWVVQEPEPSTPLSSSAPETEQMEAVQRQEGGVWLTHQRYPDAKYQYSEERMKVYAAIVPLYPKLRLSATGLLAAAADSVPMLKLWRGGNYTGLRTELSFQLSGHYLRNVMQLGIEPTGRAGTLTTTAVLPRYVGIARFFHDGGAFLDAVFDTTDVIRHEPAYSRLIALVALVEPYSKLVTTLVAGQVPHALAV